MSTTAPQFVPRRVLAVAAGVNALSAWYGAIGLASGSLSLDDTATARLPLHSPLLAGVALGVFVAVPSTVLAVLAWRGDRRAGAAAILAGLVLVGWIVVQAVALRAFSWFQPVYVLVGLGFLLAGLWREQPTIDVRRRLTS